MLFNPFEEKFHLPAVLVKEHDLLGRQIEIIGIKDKASLQGRGYEATILLIRDG